MDTVKHPGSAVYGPVALGHPGPSSLELYRPGDTVKRDCVTCKHGDLGLIEGPCITCGHGGKAYDRWEPEPPRPQFVPAPTALNTSPELFKALRESAGGAKFDQDKPRLDLIEREWVEGTGRVLGFGAKKYAAHNWRKGIEVTRLIGAALRHTFAFLAGENTDPESGESHLYHASCCLMFASWMVTHRPEKDDRFKEVK